ncbi:MAG TPA: hypothetical protein VKA27_14060, partial [Sunxiuqinia sp.]|nr:hypothetical protein [Sunxiuqinia sp.]
MKISLVILIFVGFTTTSLQIQSNKDRCLENNPKYDIPKDQPASTPGIVYFSSDNGLSWQNESQGLPQNIFLTDIAVSNQHIAISTKQQGIFLFDFKTDRWNPTVANPQSIADIDALFFFQGKLLAGSQGDGVFFSFNNGKNWQPVNEGLKNLTIRKLVEINNQLYAGTNGGLFVFNELKKQWVPAFVDPTLQVNGIIEFEGEIYLGTNKGAYRKPNGQDEWQQLMPGLSLHNISSARNRLYALAYNELF